MRFLWEMGGFGREVEFRNRGNVPGIFLFPRRLSKPFPNTFSNASDGFGYAAGADGGGLCATTCEFAVRGDIREDVIDHCAPILHAEVRVTNSNQFEMCWVTSLVERRCVGLGHKPTAPLGSRSDVSGHTSKDRSIDIGDVEEHDGPSDH